MILSEWIENEEFIEQNHKLEGFLTIPCISTEEDIINNLQTYRKMIAKDILKKTKDKRLYVHKVTIETVQQCYETKTFRVNYVVECGIKEKVSYEEFIEKRNDILVKKYNKDTMDRIGMANLFMFEIYEMLKSIGDKV